MQDLYWYQKLFCFGSLTSGRKSLHVPAWAVFLFGGDFFSRIVWQNLESVPFEDSRFSLLRISISRNKARHLTVFKTTFCETLGHQGWYPCSVFWSPTQDFPSMSEDTVEDRKPTTPYVTLQSALRIRPGRFDHLTCRLTWSYLLAIDILWIRDLRYPRINRCSRGMLWQFCPLKMVILGVFWGPKPKKLQGFWGAGAGTCGIIQTHAFATQTHQEPGHRICHSLIPQARPKQIFVCLKLFASLFSVLKLLDWY